MSGVFSNQIVTVAGRTLIASATATNQIVFVKALSATTVPTDPSDPSGYDGVQGTIASSSATNNVARVVTSYTNAPSSAPQPVKAIALMGRLASQSDAEAVIFAYCTDSGSEIYFPGNNAPAQLTRFAFNIAFDGTAPLEVVEAGAASLSDLERFVSRHRAGDPTHGEDQTIFGDKYWYGQQDFDEACRFYNTVETHSVWPETDNKYSLGLQNARYNAIYGETVDAHAIDVCSASTSVSGKATLTYVDDALVSDKDFVPANTDVGTQTCGRLSRPWKELYVRDAIHLTRGGDDSTLTIYEDDGAIYFDSGYTGGSEGAFFFSSHTGSWTEATVYAGHVISDDFNGPNLTVSKASISKIPTGEVIAELYNGDVVTVPVGGLILVIPNQTWMINGGAGRSIKPGESIVIAQDDRYAFYIADWTVDSSGSRYIGKSLDIGGTWAFLKTGTYRALCFIDYPANSSSPTSGVPILLQRIA